MSLPTVAIVGRPNVGKSTLVNRIVGKRVTIVEERPGVTRDRKEVQAEWRGRDFVVIDTGGWMGVGDALDDKVSAQSEEAIRTADVIVMVVDGTVGVTEDDAQVAGILRKAKAPVLLAVNKVDGENREALIWNFLSLGIGEPIPISALHGRRTGDFLDHVYEALPPGEDAEVESDDEEEDGPRTFAVSIVGRPNVGKSTLFNQLIGEDRAVVHDMPGTTRDSVDTLVETEFGPIKFVDTAGMRRRAKVDEGTEYYSFVRALQSVDKSDVALLVIDTTVGVTAQDQRLAERVDAAGCPVVVMLNKWEMLTSEQRRDVEYQLERKLHFIGDSPVLKISALSGMGVHKLWPALTGAIDDYSTRVPTRKVNEVLRAAQQSQPGPAGARVLYATQGATDPPTFTLFTNKALPPTYVRYLERRLREEFALGATPIKMRVRPRAE